MISLNTYLCVVCDERKPNLFQIADCGHQFCSQCCIAYIKSQAENFAKAKCLQQGCQAELNKSKLIYKQLDADTIKKIDNYQLFMYLQGNKDAVGCKKNDCKGYFLLSAKKGVCLICESQHCILCNDLSHLGECVSKKQEEAEMRSLNYRRCPKCSIWVEKIAGCEYINCKCGIEFCYKCGFQFSNDPCRKQAIWKKQSQIRKLMSNMKLNIPSSLPNLFVLILRIILLVLIVVPFTVIFCTVPLLIGIVLVEVLIFILLPLALIFLVKQTPECQGKCKCVVYISLIMFYPLLGAIFALIGIIIILIYPYARNKYHHGIYDPLDLVVSGMAFYYLKFINLILVCCT